MWHFHPAHTSAVRVLWARLAGGDKKKAQLRTAARPPAFPQPSERDSKSGTRLPMQPFIAAGLSISDGAGTPHGHLDPAAPLVMSGSHHHTCREPEPWARGTLATRFLSSPRIVAGCRGTPTSMGRRASLGTIGPHDAGKPAGIISARAARCFQFHGSQWLWGPILCNPNRQGMEKCSVRLCMILGQEQWSGKDLGFGEVEG
jgi:hypothetical protein